MQSLRHVREEMPTDRVTIMLYIIPVPVGEKVGFAIILTKIGIKTPVFTAGP